MAVTLRNLSPLFIFILSLLGLALVPMPGGSASAQPPCIAFICKSAPELPPAQSEGDLVFFPFVVVTGDISEPVSIPANVERCTPVGIGTEFGTFGTEVFEEFTPGWILSGIECDESPGIGVTVFDDGVGFECLSEGQVTCTFTNIRGVETNIPTLSEWGMISAAAGLGLIGAFFAVRRRKARAV